jgi:hypothetical protein
MEFKTLTTLGHQRKEFHYSGSIQIGVVLHQSSHPRIDHAFFAAALSHFAGQTVKGGFKQDDPPSGGFGEWVQNQSERLNSNKLTPRHGSFMAAILCDESGVKSSLDGNAVILQFPGVHSR